MTLVKFPERHVGAAAPALRTGSRMIIHLGNAHPLRSVQPMAAAPPLDMPLGGRLLVPAESEKSTQPRLYAICSTCHGPAAAGRRNCWSCAVAAAQLGPLPAVLPVFLFGLGSPAHRALVGYKASVTLAGRDAWGQLLSGMLAEWLSRHGDCVLGERDGCLVVPVPSSSGGRPSWGDTHPLESLSAGALADCARLQLATVLRPGAQPPRRLRATAVGFAVERPHALRGRTVIVLDDMFVSGARSLSAAAALSGAGARVAAVVPLGRLVRPDHNEATGAFWAARRALPADPALCSRCSAPRHAVPYALRRGPQRASALPLRTHGVSERLAA